MTRWLVIFALFFGVLSAWLITPASPLPVYVYNRNGVQFFSGSLKFLLGDGQSIHIFINEDSVPMVLSCSPVPLKVRP